MNITYLLGAGASSECLPIYKNFRARFAGFLYFLAGQKDRTPPEELTDLNEMIEILEGINKEFAFHNTPDTIAKKYFHLKNEHKLDLIKRALILFFLYEQTLNLPVYNNLSHELIKDIIDKRYDSFIAGLLKPIPNKLALLDNVNILTWNYDLQFEIAFSRYFNDSIAKVQDHIQSFPKILSNDKTFSKDSFSLIHLNGIAYARPDKGYNDEIGNFINKESQIPYLTKIYHALCTVNPMHDIGGSSLLTFAWENINTDYALKNTAILNNALEVAEKTEILVINGYSFPVFNRSIDQKIFEKMTSLDRVYIQSPQATDIENIMKNDLLENKIGVDFVDLGYWNQFYIPSEWSKKKNNDTFPLAFR